VGMSEVFVPVQVKTKNGLLNLGATSQLSINLNKPEIRGIHMSRLYLHAQKTLPHQPLCQEMIHNLLSEFIATQEGLCDKAFINIAFELPLLRKALITESHGWKKYPIEIQASLTKEEPLKLTIHLRVDYGSTCPCSTALAKSHICDSFVTQHPHKDTFTKEEVTHWLNTKGLTATPHGQRSHAFISMQRSQNAFDFEDLINTIEDILSTPTQTAVKRQDEQQFAALSAENTMFAEDAARKLTFHLAKLPHIQHFEAQVFHYESLHSHDAYAIASSDAILPNPEP